MTFSLAQMDVAVHRFSAGPSARNFGFITGLFHGDVSARALLLYQLDAGRTAFLPMTPVKYGVVSARTRNGTRHGTDGRLGTAVDGRVMNCFSARAHAIVKNGFETRRASAPVTCERATMISALEHFVARDLADVISFRII